MFNRETDEYKARMAEIDEQYGEDLPDALDSAIDFIENPNPQTLKDLQLAILYTLPPTDLNRQYIEEVRK